MLLGNLRNEIIGGACDPIYQCETEIASGSAKRLFDERSAQVLVAHHLACVKELKRLLLSPTLWTRLDMLLDLRSSHAGSAPISEDLIRSWFTRARSLPLSLSFSGERGNRQLESRLNTILLPHAANLRNLQLDMHTEPSSALGNTIHFPLLRRLALNCFYNSRFHGKPIEAFRVAPQLRTLSLQGLPPSLVSVPWEKLTTVDLCCIGIAESLTVLRDTPCLREFTFQYSDGDDEHNYTPVIHAGLVSLSLLQLGATAYIIPFLVLPSLENLTMEEIQDPGNTIIPLPLISSLRSFTFSNSAPMVSLQWIRHMEHLTTLELGSLEWPQGYQLFRALNRAYEPQFLPKLLNLVLLEWDAEDPDDDLVKALDSRRMPAQQGLAMLQSSRIVWSSDLDNETVDRYTRAHNDCDELYDLVEGGLKFLIGNKDLN
ncbi:hypothetical protein C8J57DRAFT_1713704 [Mycena rebaudengoi]|nr:hypothetical protein C8J57DRAFT_1713704 [Mycena rebaudengoi]